jgi:two-component system, OmpR family, sensor histidine kinase KdpD
MIMQKTDQNEGSGPLFKSGKDIRKEKTEKLKQFLMVLVMLIITTILNIFLERFIQPSSLVFVYLVPAIAGALYYGTWTAVLAFTAGFLIFDFGFVEPYYSLHISKPQDIYNVTVYFTVAALITYLINLVRRQNIFLKGRLDRVSLIEDMSRDFLLLTPIEQNSSVLSLTDSLRTMVFSQLGRLALKYTKMVLDVPALVFFREEDGSLKIWAKSSVDLEMTKQDNAAAIWTLTNGEVSGAGTYTHSDNQYYFIPMKSIEDIIGVMGILYNSKDLFPEQRRLLGTITNLTTMVASMWMNLKFKHSP